MREGARRSEKDVYGGGDQCMVQAFQALCGKPMGWWRVWRRKRTRKNESRQTSIVSLFLN